MNISNKQINGYVMAGVGFAMILINAVTYILGLSFKHPAFGIMGLVFVAVGMKTVCKKIN